MLARKGQLVHDALALPIDLPLLVPSFSSKGFSHHMVGNRREYEVAGDLADFPNRPAKSVLVSAYDLHFRHLDLWRHEEESTHRAESALYPAELVFLDSGGYELDRHFDSCEPRSGRHTPPDESFSEDNYLAVIQALTQLPRMPPLCIASFDHGYKGKLIHDQVQAARRTFASLNRCMHSFIIKPVKDGGVVRTDEISARAVSEFRTFDVIGVTADELGANLLGRLERIAALRTALNQAHISAPIHVWGGLDPVVTSLYFFAGAEIFDGVSWLRYGFCNGTAVNRRSYQILSAQLGIQENNVLVRGTMTTENRVVLNQLALALRAWASSGGKDYDGFDTSVQDQLRRAYRVMQDKISGV